MLVGALRDASLGTGERLKVACALARGAGSIPSENRPAFLAKWACEEICHAYDKRNRSPPGVDVCSQLWEFLASVWRSQQLLREMEKEGPAPCEAQLGPLVSVHLLQAMGDVLAGGATEQCMQPVLNCLLCVLREPLPLPPILYKFEVVVSLLLALLVSATGGGECVDEGGVVARSQSVEKVLCLLLDHFSYLQATQGNHKKVFKAVCGQLLAPVVRLSQSPLVLDGSGALREKLDTLLCSLFSRDHLSEFSSALSGSTLPEEEITGRSQRSEMSYTKLLFSGLWDLVHRDTTSGGERLEILSVIPTLFQGFLQQNRELKRLSKAIEFNFFLRLLEVIGFNLPGTGVERVPSEGRDTSGGSQKKRAKIDLPESERDLCDEDGEVGGGGEGMEGDCKVVGEDGKRDTEVDWEQLLGRIHTESHETEECGDISEQIVKVPVLKVLKTCLHLLRLHNVYQVMEDRSRGSRQFNCLSSLCTELVKNLNRDNLAVVVECLYEALQLNHKLVEPLLSGLLLLATCICYSRERLDQFVKQCITVYSKLHQMNVLVGSLFSALQELATSPNLPSTFSPTLSKPSEDWFCRHVREMPAGQCAAIIEQVTHSLRSVFLERLRPPDEGERVGEGEMTRRKKRRRSQRENGVAVPVSEVVSGCFASGLLRGVDLLSLVLLNTPLSVWTSEGLHKERARRALQVVQSDVQLPLMEAARDTPGLQMAALHLSLSLQTLLFCLRDILSPTLPPSVPVENASQASPEIPLPLFVSGGTKLVWCGGESSWPVPELWRSGHETDNGAFTATSTYILKALSVQQLRFAGDSLSPDELAQFMDYIFGAVECELNPESSWSGQQLDVDDRNLPIAVWDLALSSLYQLRSQCLPAHLHSIARFLHSALLGPTERGGGEKGEGLTAREVACRFLCSECFQEMRQLQEVVVGLCFENTSSCLPKSLKELKAPLLSCGARLLESSEHLARATELGLQLLVREEDRPGKRRKSVSKSSQNISVCLEVMRAVPMAFSHPELLHRCVLALSILHITLAESLCCREGSYGSVEEGVGQLCELQLVLAWVLQSLTHCDRLGRKKTQRLSPLPFSDLLSWSYSASRHCSELIEDKAKEFRRASLLLMEAELEACLKTGSYPASFVQTIVEDVSSVLASRHENDSTDLAAVMDTDSLPLSVLHLTVARACKAYSELKPSQREDSALHLPVGELLRKMTTYLSQLRRKRRGSGPIPPQLVSSFSLLIRTSPPSDPALQSKCLKVARWLSDMLCSEKSLQSTVVDFSKLLPVLDVLSIPATTRAEGDTDTALSLTDSWAKSLEILKLHLRRELEMSGSNGDHYLVDVFSGTVEGSGSFSSSGRREKSLSQLHCVLPQISGTMKRLLSAADRDQTKSIFETLHQESCEDTAEGVAVCHCWSVVLSARLQPESQRELRKWHTKILLQCGSLAVQHRGVAPIVILSLKLTIRLVALPTKVGLDSRLVLMSLHQTTVIGDTPEFKSQRSVVAVLQSVGQLLLTVLKHHSSVAASCPGPIITTTNNLLRIALEQCAGRGEGEGGEGEGKKGSTTVANTLSRILDHLASQQEFTRYVPSVLGCCVTAMAHNPPSKPVKTSLLPGVYALVRRCSDEDTGSVLASLDPNSRTHFQSLVENFKKQKRFL